MIMKIVDDRGVESSHISHVVGDAAWEQYAANVFEKSLLVTAYAKNDHLDFQIHYLWDGSRLRYLPDFLVRLTNGATLVLEIKGQDSTQTQAKHADLDQWTRALNAADGFGRWCWAAAFAPTEAQDILTKHGGFQEQ